HRGNRDLSSTCDRTPLLVRGNSLSMPSGSTARCSHGEKSSAARYARVPSSMHVRRSSEEKDHVATAAHARPRSPPPAVESPCSPCKRPPLAIGEAVHRSSKRAPPEVHRSRFIARSPAAGGDHRSPMHGFAAAATEAAPPLA
ncbi:hypothetical protein Dimus_005318, partial [Dionaea muscipula]